MEFQTELRQTFLEVLKETHGIGSMLEAQRSIVGVADDDDLALGHFPAPDIRPQVENVMKVNVGDQWRNHSPYTKGNFDREFRQAVDCRLAVGPAAGLKCYVES